MAMIPCLFCKKKIDAAASRCPYCQGEYTPDQVAARTKNANKTMAIGCAGIAIGLALLVGMCSGSGESVSAPEAPTATAKADALQLYELVLKTVEPCDRAADGLSIMLKSGDSIGSYRSAENASAACLGVPGEIRRMKIPVSVGAVHYKNLTSTLETCENAYVSKWSAVKSLTKALNGDGKVSTLADMQASAEASQAGTIMCVGGFASVATQLGVKPGELPGAEKGNK